MHQHSALVYIQISEYDFKILSSHGVHESAFAKPSLPHHHQRELKPPLHRLSVHLSIRKGLKLIDLRSFWSINKAGHLIGKVCKTNIAIKLSRRFSHWLALRRDNSLKLESWLVSVIKEYYLRFRRHIPGFGGQFWFLGTRMWTHPVSLSCA